ncbi:MAG: hypothetical protein GY927_18585 [bacterium]|nr:hypothetical protein [bacterium]
MADFSPGGLIDTDRGPVHQGLQSGCPDFTRTLHTLLAPKHSTRRSNATLKGYEPFHVVDQIHHTDADAGALNADLTDQFLHYSHPSRSGCTLENF